MKDNFTELIRAASTFSAPPTPASSPGPFSIPSLESLSTSASSPGLPHLSADFERRVMMEVARCAILRSRRRARRGLVASFAGLSMLFAGCVIALVSWFPTLLPAFTSPPRWLERFWDSLSGIFVSESAGRVASMTLFEQWGGVLLVVLVAGGFAGGIYYLNSLFSSDLTTD